MCVFATASLGNILCRPTDLFLWNMLRRTRFWSAGFSEFTQFVREAQWCRALIFVVYTARRFVELQIQHLSNNLRSQIHLFQHWQESRYIFLPRIASRYLDNRAFLYPAQKIQEELPNKFNNFLSTHHSLALEDTAFSVWIVNYCLFVLYPLISSVTTAAEDECFSTSESICVLPYKTRYTCCFERWKDKNFVVVCSFLKVTVKVEVCIVTMKKYKAATKHDVFYDANDLSWVT